LPSVHFIRGKLFTKLFTKAANFRKDSLRNA
jgi:hypothetical protein